MTLKDQNNREVEITVQGRHHDDIMADGYYVDTLKPISDETLQFIYDNCEDELYSEWCENQIGQADFLSDFLQDR